MNTYINQDCKHIKIGVRTMIKESYLKNKEKLKSAGIILLAASNLFLYIVYYFFLIKAI